MMCDPEIWGTSARRDPRDPSDVTMALDVSELPSRILVYGALPPFESVRFVPERVCHATSGPPVPEHFTGCSACGAVWDFFYVTGGYMGPPDYCPRCGARCLGAGAAPVLRDDCDGGDRHDACRD